MPFPVALGGPFELTDHKGQRRGSADFAGRYQIIFFGYARCDAICPVALQNALDAIDILGSEGDRIQPLLITVDPEETPEVLAVEIPRLHPKLIGLTGSAEELSEVRSLYKVNAELVGRDIKGESVFSHGSYLYLLGPDGEFLTLFPPILSGEILAEKLKVYL